jgi:GT2 family glycosyltransferase
MNISVCILSYNQKFYLDEAIKSVLSQTLMPHEIIVVDDASSTQTISRFLNVCPIAESRHERKYFSALYTGIIILTSGPIIIRTPGFSFDKQQLDTTSPTCIYTTTGTLF